MGTKMAEKTVGVLWLHTGSLEAMIWIWNATPRLPCLNNWLPAGSAVLEGLGTFPAWPWGLQPCPTSFHFSASKRLLWCSQLLHALATTPSLSWDTETTYSHDPTYTFLPLRSFVFRGLATALREVIKCSLISKHLRNSGKWGQHVLVFKLQDMPCWVKTE